MKTQTLKIVCFSPSGTTKSIAQAIAQGINPGHYELIDITTPELRKQPLPLSENDILLIAVPVYMGRVPAVLSDYFNSIDGANTPVICVVVYGNRVFDNALLELSDILTSRGCIPIAGAAFIAEHSFSASGIKTAQGRPDTNDLIKAKEFGVNINTKLSLVSSVMEISKPALPGTYPYGGLTQLWDLDFIAINETCDHCKTCYEVCPVGAINPLNCSQIDTVKCITCCACIMRCPQKARSVKPSPLMDAAIRLNNLYKERKEPSIFI